MSDSNTRAIRAQVRMYRNHLRKRLEANLLETTAASLVDAVIPKNLERVDFGVVCRRIEVLVTELQKASAFYTSMHEKTQRIMAKLQVEK